MKGRRTQYEIFWEILIFCKTPRSYTSIIHKCNLNSKICQDYLDFLREKNYLVKNENGNKTSYETSENAQEFLLLFSKLYRELFEKSP